MYVCFCFMHSSQLLNLTDLHMYVYWFKICRSIHLLDLNISVYKTKKFYILYTFYDTHTVE